MSNMPPPPPPPSPGPPGPPPDPGSYGSSGMTGWAMTGTGQQLELAGAGARLGARIIDVVIMVVVAFVLIVIGIMALFGFADDSATDDEQTIGLAFLIATWGLVVLIGLLYEVVMIATRGQTLGKMMTSVKVVRADNGSVPGWGKSIVRWIIPTIVGVILAVLIPGIGGLLSLLVYVSLLWDSARQGWHDKAAGTLVIKV